MPTTRAMTRPGPQRGAGGGGSGGLRVAVMAHSWRPPARVPAAGAAVATSLAPTRRPPSPLSAAPEPGSRAGASRGCAGGWPQTSAPSRHGVPGALGSGHACGDDSEPGGPEVLGLGRGPRPGVRARARCSSTSSATAVNRADLLQRQGFYPPPPGASEILGLECSGVVSEVGEGVTGWSVGDEVCALLAGGGYAERVAVPAGQLLPAPGRRRAGHRGRAARGHLHRLVQRVHARRAARRARPSWCTAARSGIGTMAIQLAARRRRPGRHHRRARRPSSTSAASWAPRWPINYRDEDFVERVKEATDGAGADVVLDIMGAKYLARNVDVARRRRPAGRHRHAGRHEGRAGPRQADGASARRCTRRRCAPARPTGRGGKAEIVAAVRHDVWPRRRARRRPPDRRPPAADVPAADAHRLVEASEHIGKVLLLPED